MGQNFRSAILLQEDLSLEKLTKYDWQHGLTRHVYNVNQKMSSNQSWQAMCTSFDWAVPHKLKSLKEIFLKKCNGKSDSQHKNSNPRIPTGRCHVNTANTAISCKQSLLCKSLSLNSWMTVLQDHKIILANVCCDRCVKHGKWSLLPITRHLNKHLQCRLCFYTSLKSVFLVGRYRYQAEWYHKWLTTSLNIK